jgi:di/tricarboxylate transporter
VTVTVTPQLTPTFNPASYTICTGATAPTLPLTSVEGIAGTWSPATVSNTATATYTFTPTGSTCATTAQVTVTVTPQLTPTFNPASYMICTGATAPTLPLTSVEGIAGTWSPATVSNTATATYTFTPTGSTCATTAQVTVTVTPQLTPTFNPASYTICSGATAPTLPLTSVEGIAGTWSPATVSNTATATYTFTPTGSTCASTAQITVTVTHS